MLQSFLPFSSELWLIATLLAVLIVPFFTKHPSISTPTVALAGVCFAFTSLFFTDSSPHQYFHNLLLTDPVSTFWKGTLLLFTAAVLILWFATHDRSHDTSDAPEYLTLLLGATLGMSLMASTNHLLMIFLSFELASLPSYVLAGFRKTHRLGAEASLKYVLFGAASSAVMAYGLSLLYGLFHSLSLPVIAHVLAASPSFPPLAAIALIAVATGLGFKIAAAPFHLWCPDVFEGAPIDIAVFLSVASKGAALVLSLRTALTFAAAYNYAPTTPLIALSTTIAIIAAITCTLGNTAALAQTNIKRLLAYSSIAHAGYMLCAVSILLKTSHSAPGFTPSIASTESLLLYLAVYMFMNLGAFSVLAIVHHHTGRDTLDAFQGLGRTSPIAAGCMFCSQISLIGLIPFAGFTAKLNILFALFRAGGWWWALIVTISLNTVLSAFYYFRIVRAMYFEPPSPPNQPRYLGPPLILAIALTSSLILFSMLLLFSPMSRLTTHFSQWSSLTLPN
ncbi:MAG TPA: NADH-quinone oxidoreductase subunit N [Tepidisphaeraceae bacterium]|jgi:NADH-quinone oxidoreductase subunit N|nr:NADH-quinone oxidoreductase subunit N [Tepidisphaeraceae bacterium]